MLMCYTKLQDKLDPAVLYAQVIIAAELLKNADELVKQKIHPTSIIGGYRLACNTKARTCASLILRGANDFMCDEMERSVHDALCVVKRVLESKSVVPGGGAVEAALSIYLENYATSM
ncbi:hypothetical protein AB205_0159140, partial [Aquarana catesbeiana]